MKRALLAVLILMATIGQAQTGSTSQMRHGSSLPATCDPNKGDTFFKTSATIGPYYCSATNTWSAMFGSGGSGVPDMGTTANIAAVTDGSHSITPATGSISTGGSGTSAITIVPTTIGGLSGLTPSTGDVVLVSDGATCGDTATGGGTVFEWVKYNGSTWDVTACGLSTSNGAEVLISEQILASPAASITFSSIASTYRDLIIRCQARGSASSDFVNGQVRINGDTGGDYDNAANFANTSWTNANAVGSNAALASSAVFPAATAVAGYAGSLEITIQNYKGTTFYKQGNWKAGMVGSSVTTGGIYQTGGSFWWRSTSAITSVSVAPASGNFIAGSRCSLYGSY